MVNFGSGTNTLLGDPSDIRVFWGFKIDVFHDVREFMIFARQQGGCLVLEQANENWNVCLAGPVRHKQGDL